MLLKLALLWLGLASFACGGFFDACYPPSKSFDEIVGVDPPAVDGGAPEISADSFGLCARTPPDCLALCAEIVSDRHVSAATIITCERLPDVGAGDAGAGLRVHLAYKTQSLCL
jgi:hypothetical protein